LSAVVYTRREADGLLLGFWIPGVHWMDRCIFKRRCGNITDKGMINFIKREPLIGRSCAYFRYTYILLHLYFAQRDSGSQFGVYVYGMVGHFVYFAVFRNGYILHSRERLRSAQS
jgi:hypothetical protein